MEYCSGGSLLDKFIKMGKVKETEAARIMEKLFSVVEYLHSNGISHRDLKPENFLFVDKSKDSEIRIIDFGLSTSLI
jgi:calcium-dependent protein kinase